MLMPAYLFPGLVLWPVPPVVRVLLLLSLCTAFFIITPFSVMHKGLGLFPAASEVLLTPILLAPGALVPVLRPFMPLVMSLFFLVMHLLLLLR